MIEALAFRGAYLTALSEMTRAGPSAWVLCQEREVGAMSVGEQERLLRDWKERER